jgi:6-phosphogluconolactonase
MTSLYASVGPRLIHYSLDEETGNLTEKDTLVLPYDIPYGWLAPSGRHLYVASSDTLPKRRNPGVPPGTDHRLYAVLVADDGSLSFHGEPVRLPARPVHLSTDGTGEHVLVAFNRPSAMHVIAIREDGALDADDITLAPSDDIGIFAHQVRVTPDDRLAILVTRGNDAEDGRAEEPGALKVYPYSKGRLGPVDTVAPGGGFGFGPRHLDFHPTKPWAYVLLERQNELAMFRTKDDRVAHRPDFVVDSLADRDAEVPRQVAGAVHVHPDGHAVYVSNRAYTPVDHNGRSVLVGGENSIAVFGIEPETGEPTVLQHVGTGGVNARTFHVSPSGRSLVAANLMPMDVLTAGGSVQPVPAGFAVYDIAQDGTLELRSMCSVDVGDKSLYWMTIAGQ